MPALQSLSGCQPVFVRAGYKYSCTYPNNPIDLTWAATFGEISRCQISAHFADKHPMASSTLHRDIFENLKTFLAEYL